MNPQAVLKKTEKGVEEIQTRKYHLDQRLRTLLIVVNGQLTAGQLVDRFGRLGDVEPLLTQLLEQGFVRGAASENYRDIRLQLSQALSDALGPDGDPVVMQLESCKSPDALRKFVIREREMLESVPGPRIVKFFKLARDLLG